MCARTPDIIRACVCVCALRKDLDSRFAVSSVVSTLGWTMCDLLADSVDVTDVWGEQTVCDHRQSDQLETVDGRRADRTGQRRQRCSKAEQQHCTGKREGQKRGDGTAPAGTQQTQGEAELAAGRPRQELAQGKQLRVLPFAHPLPALHQFPVEKAQMGNGSAKRGQAELEKGSKDLGRRSGFHFRVCTDDPHVVVKA